MTQVGPVNVTCAVDRVLMMARDKREGKKNLKNIFDIKEYL